MFSLDQELSLLKQAYKYAQGFSTDPSTQNGALLVNDHCQVLLESANMFPLGVLEHPYRWIRPLKYSYVEHAERNLIYEAAKRGISTKGMCVYCPWFSCSDCARALIQAGIKEVVGHASPLHETLGSHWKDSCFIGDQMYKEAGVKYRRLVADNLGVAIRFGGELIIP